MMISTDQFTETHVQKDTIRYRNVIEAFHLKLDVPFSVTPYDQRLHDICCRRAIDKGYPMGTDPTLPSIRPFIPSGVVMAATAYAHLKNEETQVLISLLTAFAVFVDDMSQRDDRVVRVFVNRFVRGEKQEEPFLDSFAHLLQEIPDHFESIVDGIVLTSFLNFINASTLEFQTQGMEVSQHAEGYPYFVRQMSAIGEAYALMAFPRHIPLQCFIQCIPEAALFISYGNDVLSFYKEEIAGEAGNTISLLARCQGVPNLTAFQQLADKGVKSAAQVSKILDAHKEAHDAWQHFKAGYLGFHTSLEGRYCLAELMNGIDV